LGAAPPGWSATGPRLLVALWIAPDPAGPGGERIVITIPAGRPGKVLVSAAQLLITARGVGPFSRPPPSATRRTLPVVNLHAGSSLVDLYAHWQASRDAGGLPCPGSGSCRCPATRHPLAGTDPVADRRSSWSQGHRLLIDLRAGTGSNRLATYDPQSRERARCVPDRAVGLGDS
jgi:hypothetical protein